MVKSELNELASFALVASERNFTRAAARLGLTQSALSHSVRGLEQKLGVQLLARTSRTVAPTAAGAALLRQLSPALEQIEGALAEVKKLREHARIEYLGEFEAARAQPASSGAAVADHDDSIRKGVAGLR